jgi:DNA-binding response OmpR family regulator
MTSRTWRIELTLDELAAIEHALARVFTEEMRSKLVRRREHAAALGSALLTDTAIGMWPARPGGSTASIFPQGAQLRDRQLVLLDEHALAVTILGERFACKPTSFRILSHLIHRRGHWVRAEALKREVLQTSFQDGASNVRWHVLQARRALGSRRELLHSDNRLGFMFELARCDRRHCASEPLE